MDKRLNSDGSLIIGEHSFEFDLLKETKEFDQECVEFHPEKYLLVHLIQVSSQLKNENLELFLAGVFHDIGKLNTKAPHKKIEGRYTYYGHEYMSVKLLKTLVFPELLKIFPDLNVEKISWLIANHMKIKQNMRETKLDILRKSEYYDDLKKLEKADTIWKEYP